MTRLDNLCHTLVGAALGEAGLKRATPYFVVRREGNAAFVAIHDPRYPGEFGSWAVLRLKLPAGPDAIPP